jgi:hypothetical protein
MVEVAALDDVVRDRSSTLIKVDAEGHEYGVPQGGRKTLGRTRCPAVFESPAGDGTSATNDVAELLISYGYENFSLGPRGLTSFRHDSHSQNLLAIHESDEVSRRRMRDVQIPRNQNN